MNYELSLPCAGFGSARLDPRRQLKNENGPQLSTGTWRSTLCPGSVEITLSTGCHERFHLTHRLFRTRIRNSVGWNKPRPCMVDARTAVMITPFQSLRPHTCLRNVSSILHSRCERSRIVYLHLQNRRVHRVHNSLAHSHLGNLHTHHTCLWPVHVLKFTPTTRTLHTQT